MDFKFLGLILIFFLLFFITPAYDYETLNKGFYMGSLETERGELLYYKEGLYGSVVIEEYSPIMKAETNGNIIDLPVNYTYFGNFRTMKINGRAQCGTGKFAMRSTIFLGAFPLLFHESPTTALNIGLGCGTTLGALEEYPFQSIDTVEIDPVIVEAARYFDDVHNNALDDPRSNIIVADARNYLLTTDKKYDIIVSEPFDPWMSGSTHLFSKEAFEAMRDHLNDKGVASIWVPIFELRENDFKSFYRTFSTVFPYNHGFIVKEKIPDSFHLGGEGIVVSEWKEVSTELILIGSNQPLELYQDVVDKQLLIIGNVFVEVDVVDLGDFYLFNGNDLVGYAENAPLNTDDYPIVEFSAARNMYDSRPEEVINSIRDYLISIPPTITGYLAAQSPVATEGPDVLKARNIVENPSFEKARAEKTTHPENWYWSYSEEKNEIDEADWPGNPEPLTTEGYTERAIVYRYSGDEQGFIESNLWKIPESGIIKMVFYFKPGNMSHSYGYVWLDLFNDTYDHYVKLYCDNLPYSGYSSLLFDETHAWNREEDACKWENLKFEEVSGGWKRISGIFRIQDNPEKATLGRFAISHTWKDVNQRSWEENWFIIDDVTITAGE